VCSAGPAGEIKALEGKLAGRNFLDAAYPTVTDARAFDFVSASGFELDTYPNVRRWSDMVGMFTQEIRASWPAPPPKPVTEVR
jgi:hypothetical protein